ncbi:glycosyltransferase [Enterococcus faecium]|uniref:glycosyltransferase n=1 Tax=Enterococcus faecium TaxID=1352 RepID=UPI000BF02F5D|nr:glycosyltransferase [Enterococcus faecium]PEH49533.1 colanic acid biosynthesis glycosyltransferase WcaL [Enterococcus faecium]
MKVLIFISTFPKPSETFIFNQIEELISNGAEINILAWNKYETSITNKVIEKYDLEKHTQIIHLPQNKASRFIHGVPLFIKYLLKHPRLTLRSLNFIKYGPIISSLRPLYALPYFSMDGNYDAIISHYGPNGLVLSLFDDIQSGTKYTVFHGYDLSKYLKEYSRHVYNHLAHSSGYFLPVNHYFKEKLLDMGFPKDRIEVFHMGIQTGSFSQTPLVPYKEPIKLLTVGRLTEKKGIDLSIRLVNYLIENGLPCELTIIGDGENKDSYNTLIEELNLTKNVRLLGWKDPIFVKNAMGTTDFLIQLSRTAQNGDQEGIPVVLMEAMARGKLVISTKHSGIPELIFHKKNGWLVEEEDYQTAGDLIQEIINEENPETLQKISDTAVETVKQKFNAPMINKQLYDFLNTTGG